MKSLDEVVEVERRVDIFGQTGQALVPARNLGRLDGHGVGALVAQWVAFKFGGLLSSKTLFGETWEKNPMYLKGAPRTPI